MLRGIGGVAPPVDLLLAFCVPTAPSRHGVSPLFWSGHPPVAERPPDKFTKLVPCGFSHAVFVTGHLRIHGASTFTSRHKLSSIRSANRRHRRLSFQAQILKPNVLAHFHAVALGRPEIRRQLAVHGVANQIQRRSGTIRKDLFFEVDEFKSMLHALTLNVPTAKRKMLSLECVVCLVDF